MRIALIASADQSVYFFPELAKAISEKAPGMSVEEFFVPSAFDIPFQVKQSKDFDLIIACYLFDPETDATTAVDVSSKLVDAELLGDTRVVKMVEGLDPADYDSPDHWDETRIELVEKWSNIILGVLFDSSIFKPSLADEISGNEDDSSTEDK